MSTTPYFEGIARTMPQSRYVLPSFEEAIMLLVLAFMLVGNALREALNVKQ